MPSFDIFLVVPKEMSDQLNTGREKWMHYNFYCFDVNVTLGVGEVGFSLQFTKVDELIPEILWKLFLIRLK